MLLSRFNESSGGCEKILPDWYGGFFTTILSGNRSVQHEEKLEISTG